MNKNFDKLLLVGALVACAAGFGFYALNKDKQTEVKSSHAGRAPGGNAYVSVALPVLDSSVQAWTPARTSEDTELWKYDLFSSVEVKWNASIRKYEPKGEINAIAPFGIRLVSMSHPVYRLTLRGTVERKDEKTNRTYTEVLLYDAEGVREDATGEQKGKLIRAKQSDNLDADGIVVSEVKLREVTNPDGTKSRDFSVKVFDKKLNRTFEITEKPYEFKEIANIVLARDDDPSKTWILHNIGEQIKDEELGIFTLKDIDFDSATVNLEKLYKPNPRKPEVTESKTLSVTAAPSSGQAL